jgi:hypothetical protein
VRLLCTHGPGSSVSFVGYVLQEGSTRITVLDSRVTLLSHSCHRALLPRAAEGAALAVSVFPAQDLLVQRPLAFEPVPIGRGTSAMQADVEQQSQDGACRPQPHASDGGQP